MTKQEILQKCTVDGNIVRLPEGQLDRKLYQEVAKSLELIGGKWIGRKTMGFVFLSDPTDLLNQIANGEQRNLKKEFQFFATPPEIALWMVEQHGFLNPDHTILEPSAGQGALINAINTVLPEKVVDCYELMDVNRTFLSKIPTANLIGEDFMVNTNKYDRIFANPPFSKNQDIDHIYKMYESLNDGGRIVTIASKHWQISNNKKETQFREWLDEIAADTYDLEHGTFKSSGTMVGTVCLVIDKV